MSNPDLVRQMILSNPQMQQLIEVLHLATLWLHRFSFHLTHSTPDSAKSKTEKYPKIKNWVK